jgi:uncharacterized protein
VANALRTDTAGTVVGVLSDTHGLMRTEALDALRGCTSLIHAGDVGDPGVLDALRALAPLTVVRGNVDVGRWAARLPEFETVAVGGATFYVVHDLARLDLDPRVAGFTAVISGHSHHPSIERRNGVLYLNPGSCGPRRFRLPVTVARLTATGSALDAEIVELGIR